MAQKVDYELTDAEAALLMAATQESLAAAGGLGGGKPGAIGGRFGARMTRPRTAATTVESALGPDRVRQRARAAISEYGTVIEDPNAAGDGSVWGIVDSGAMDMMPALVRVQTEASTSGRLRVHVRATGREGLIKQKIGAKAADRIIDGIALGPGRHKLGQRREWPADHARLRDAEVHVDTTPHGTMSFDDTNGEPILSFEGGEWLLYTVDWDSDVFRTGVTRSDRVADARDRAREHLHASG